MPAVNALDFDNSDEQPVAPAPQAVEQEDPWGFTPAPPKKEGGKKKKKTKKDAAARQARAEEGDDSSAYPKSITPSPPTDHGVRPAKPPMTAQHESVSSPLVNVADDETTAVKEDVEPPSPPKPHPRPQSSMSPPVISPRLATAKPLAAASPPTRATSLYTAPRDRDNSLTAHRSGAPFPPPQQRRGSVASQRPRLMDPPPPHLPQAHFFGLPDLGLNVGQKQENGKPAGSNGYCCRVDSFADAGDEASARKARDALLVGSEGGLEVFALLQNKLEVVGRLEGLSGSVIDAKVLPHTERSDELQSLRPLVAVTIHGPMLDDRSDSGPEGEGMESDNDPPRHFQTSVHVYSLQTQHYIATLYRSTPVAVEQPAFGIVSSLPRPVGDLRVDAKGQFIVVSSGKSGEVLVFTQAPCAGTEETRFRCIGKFWTAVQNPSLSASKPPSVNDAATKPEDKEEHQRALFSLSQRWLAIVPPPSTASISIQGLPLLSNFNPSPPGITSHVPPSPPLTSCEVVGTDIEGAWSRLGRQAAQGLVKYSQKGIEMGLQGWKELTQPSPPGGRPAHERASSKEDIFPPTNAFSDDTSHVAKEPTPVSLVDLETLLYWEEHRPKYLALPMATFALVEGCSFLTLSSQGTRLMTASRKGEASMIWDLRQVAHGIPRRGAPQDAGTAGDATGACIKQMLRIARNSPSTVIDCAWSRDDDALALLTAHGTVHLHEIPARAPSRKRKRPSTATATAAPSLEKADATVSVSSGMSPPSANQGFLGSIKSGWQTVSTQVSSIRQTNPASAFGLPTTFAGFKEVTAAASNAGSRAVARGLSQGYTAAKGGASDYWHADDNKIRHTKALQEPLSARSLRWIRKHNTTSVVIACGGNVHVHPVQRVTRRKGDTIVSGLKHERYAHKAFPLPPITTRTEAGGVNLDACAGQGPHGFWSLNQTTLAPRNGRRTSVQASKQSQGQSSDVETNPPYCPFHVDARVRIHAFDEHDGALEDLQLRGHGLRDEEPWTFGESLPSSFRVNEHVPDDLADNDFEPADDATHNIDPQDEEEDDDDDDVASQMESRLTIQPARKSDGGDEQIRINTRRRKWRDRQGAPSRADADFELLEDDGDDGMI